MEDILNNCYVNKNNNEENIYYTFKDTLINTLVIGPDSQMGNNNKPVDIFINGLGNNRLKINYYKILILDIFSKLLDLDNIKANNSKIKIIITIMNDEGYIWSSIINSVFLALLKNGIYLRGSIWAVDILNYNKEDIQFKWVIDLNSGKIYNLEINKPLESDKIIEICNKIKGIKENIKNNIKNFVINYVQ